MAASKAHCFPLMLCAFLYAPCSQASMIIPPPPIGWELEITPGFEPGIEASIVAEYQMDSNRAAELMSAWGDRAVPVLFRLLDDGRWADFRNAITGLMQAGGEMAQAIALERFKAACAAPELTKKDEAVLSLLANGFARRLGEDLVALYAPILPKLGAKPELSEADNRLLELTCTVLGGSGSDVAAKALVDCARAGNEVVREKACTSLFRLNSRESLELARELAEQTDDANRKCRMERFVEYNMQFVRATEPMSVILEAERKGESK